MEKYDAKKLKEALQKRQVTPYDIQRSYNIPASTLYCWLNGQREISTLGQLALNYIFVSN